MGLGIRQMSLGEKARGRRSRMEVEERLRVLRPMGRVGIRPMASGRNRGVIPVRRRWLLRETIERRELRMRRSNQPQEGRVGKNKTPIGMGHRKVSNPDLPKAPKRRVAIHRRNLPTVVVGARQEDREKGTARDNQADWRQGLVETVRSKGSWESRLGDRMASTRRPGMIQVDCDVESGGICPSRFTSRCWQPPARSFCQVTARQSKRTIDG